MTAPQGALTYDERCNKQGCAETATHSIGVRCGRAIVHFGLAVCAAHGAETTVDDLVLPGDRARFGELFAVQGEREVREDRWRVELFELPGRVR